jgi:hypothetical protein
LSFKIRKDKEVAQVVEPSLRPLDEISIGDINDNILAYFARAYYTVSSLFNYY